MPFRITQRRHLLHRGNTAAVECLSDRLVQRPESVFIKVHGPDCAGDILTLQALNYAAQDDVRTDIVDRLDEGGTQHRLIGRTSCSNRSRGERHLSIRNLHPYQAVVLGLAFRNLFQ